MPLGVRVTGYLGHILGLGSAARGYISALSAADVPLSTVSVPLDHLQAPVELAPEYGRHCYEDVLNERGHAFELICVNADELPHLVERLGEDYFEGPRIGVWGWEINTIPPRWERAFTLVEEIWVYSRFMAENIGAVAPVPVVALPPPVQPPLRNRAASAPRRARRLPVPVRVRLPEHDPAQEPGRPDRGVQARVLARRGAAAADQDDQRAASPDAEEEVLWAAEGRADIHVIDRSLTAEEKDALMAACDCYVSLHRSEGFGLTMAEAMAIGKPVIATRYSGNVDFMNDENSLLVDYEIDASRPGRRDLSARGRMGAARRRARRAVDAHGLRGSRAGRAASARGRGRTSRGKLSPEATGAAMRKAPRAARGATGRGRGFAGSRVT